MKFLTAILILYLIAFSFLAIRNHDLYQTFGWDLGFFDQLLWQTSRGNLNFVSTIGDINLVGDHFQPILYLLAPLYWLWDDVRIILIAQAFIVASAAIPLYLLAKKKLEDGHSGASLRAIESLSVIPRTPARQRGGTRNLYRYRFLIRSGMTPLLISISYLFFHGTQFTLTNEFHQSAFIPLFLSWGLYFLETEKMKQGVASLFMLLLVREENAILIAGIGLMYLVRKRMKLGAGLAIVGIVSFFFLVSWVIPHIASQGKYIHFGYGEFGSTPTDVIANSLKDPLRTLQLLVSPKEKLIQVRNALLAFGGLPLLSPTSLIPVVIHYAVRFIDTRNVHRWFDTNHYAAPLGVLLAFATIQAIRNVRQTMNNERPVSPAGRRTMNGFFALLVFGIFGTNLLVRAPIFALTKSQLYFTPQWVKDANDLVASVPKDAAVAANNSLVPHLSHRDMIYLLPDIRDADYIAVDLSDGPNKYAPWGYEKMREFVDELMGNGGWIIKKQFGNGILLVKIEG